MTFNFSNMSNDDILSWVCVFVIGVFVIIAKPENTSNLFSNPIVKAILFIIIVAVVYTDLKLGILFGLAMLMTIIYSQMKTSNYEDEVSNDTEYFESFTDDEVEETVEETVHPVGDHPVGDHFVGVGVPVDDGEDAGGEDEDAGGEDAGGEGEVDSADATIVENISGGEHFVNYRQPEAFSETFTNYDSY